jgi:hypothetical protein
VGTSLPEGRRKIDEFGAVDFVDDEDFVVAVLRSGGSGAAALGFEVDVGFDLQQTGTVGPGGGEERLSLFDARDALIGALAVGGEQPVAERAADEGNWLT